MFKQRGLLAALAVMLAAVVVGLGAFGSTREADANHVAAPDEMTIFHAGFPSTPCVGGIAVPTCAVLDPGPAGGGTVLEVPVGSNFNVVVSVTSQGAPHNGYQAEIAFIDALMDFVGTTVNGPAHLDSDLTSCAPAALLPAPPLEIWGQGLGCLAPANATFANPVEEITLQCVAPTPPGGTVVALVDFASDPFGFGTTMIDLGGVIVPTVTENQIPNPLPPPALVAVVVVECKVPVDLALTKSGPAAAAVGDAGQYTITVNNPGAAPVNVDVDDLAPAGVTFTAVDNGPACTIAANAVDCNGLVAAPGNTVITVDATFDTCGVKNNSATVAFTAAPPQAVVDPNPANNTDGASTNVDCAVLTVTKTGPDGASVGDVIVYNVQICNDGGGTAAANVVVNDVPGPNPVPPNYVSIPSGLCVNSTVTVDALAAGIICNTASATQSVATGSPSNLSEKCTTISPSFQGMLKDVDPTTEGIQTTGNLWICKGAGFPSPFAGVPEGELPDNQPACNQLTISELLALSPDADTCNDEDDPAQDDDASLDGDQNAPCAGALNPDADGAPETGSQCTGFNANLDNDGDGIVNDGCPNTGNANTCPLAPGTENYIPGQTDIDCNGGEVGEGLGAIEFQLKYDHKMFQQPDIDCDTALLEPPGRHVEQVVSVVTENWSLVGCVTKDNTPGAPTPPGVLAPNGLVATVTLTIQPDLFQRLRPTKDNGVIVDLLDENCEAADIFGMPWNSNDTTQGGLLKDCGDASITIRMLEGDLDLDCEVDLTDDQMAAYRYGAFFGNLLYHKFFDLEPNIAPDFDIDIKDLQTVFGRNGSTCADPIPDQNPGSMTPDP